MLLRCLIGAKVTGLGDGLDGLVFPLDAELHFGKAHLSRAFILVNAHVVQLVIVNGFRRHAFFSSLVALGWVSCPSPCGSTISLLARQTSLFFKSSA